MGNHSFDVCKGSHKCPECPKSFTSKAKLARHDTRVHKDGAHNTWQCGKCSKTFTRRKSLNHHNKVVHEGIKPYPCQHCKMCFGCPKTLKAHNERWKGRCANGELNCPFC